MRIVAQFWALYAILLLVIAIVRALS